MPLPPATAADFQARFPREFIYGADITTVMDADVNNALTQAGMMFNPRIWCGATEQKEAFLLCAAHFLELNIRAAGGLGMLGVSVQSTGDGVIVSKSIGPVSINYAIPEGVRESPILSPFMKTNHGQLYLALAAPRLVGNVMLLSGEEDVGAAGSPTMFIPPVPPPDDI